MKLRISILALACCLTALAQNVTLTGPTSGYPGQSVSATLAVAGTGSTGLANLQWTDTTPAGIGLTAIAPLTPWSLWTTACNNTTDVCMMVDVSALATLTDGPLATETFTISQSATPGVYSIPLTSIMGSTEQGLMINTLSSGVPYSITVLSPCNFNGSPADVADVQLMINAGLGLGACPANITASSRVCNVVTVQQTIVAALGGACLL